MNITTAELAADGIIVRADYEQREVWKTVPGWRWDPLRKAWVLPVTERALESLRNIFPIRLDDELQRRLQVETEAGQTQVEGLRGDMPVRNVTPYRHQREAYTLALEHPAFAVFHEPGLGKSMTTVAVMGRRYLDGQIKRALIVAPLSVVPVWGEEIARYAAYPVQAAALEGNREKKLKKLHSFGNTALAVAVINYEYVWRIEKELKAWKPDMIILDESQRIKSHTTIQSKSLHRLGTVAPYRMILTGTPVGNSPMDFWSQYQFLQPGLFEPVFSAFRNHYAIMGGYEGKQITAFKNMDELTRKAHSIAHRAKKGDALDLPPYTDQTLYCTLEAKSKTIYSQLKRDAVARLSEEERVTADRIITQMLRLSQLTGGFVRADGAQKVTEAGTSKLDLLEECLNDRMTDERRKVVIFARFLAEISAIEQMVKKKLGLGFRTINGAAPGELRGQYVREFQENREVRVFISQTRTAGLGITLHAADTAVFYSLDYSYMDYEQARARIHRAGQNRPCTAVHLLAKDTIDETVLDALRGKKNLAEAIVDNWREVFS